ncbi:hypothetical protein BHE74_00012011 [Ensete ventricosum]|nr:hypothetical protein GW17_00015866 [Ensete ventricosum]RWW79682.1 hypothetical protein BHE74_00012011 [Ensete ventricosum]RZS02393.1 hypothetical protein BHM03_00032435 [Ensete ventricosum]
MLPLHISIHYVDSLHAAWILHQVPPRLLRLSLCIELMVALMPTIQRVSPPLSLISTSTLSVSSYDVAIVAPPLDLAMHPPMHYFIRNHATTPRCSFGPLSFVDIVLRNSSSTYVVRCT